MPSREALRALLRSSLRPGALIRLGIALVAGAAIWFVIAYWIGDRTSIAIDWLPMREVDLLNPQWLLLFSVVPAFYLLRVLSLTDLSTAQQILQASLRSLVIAGIAIALARPSWVTEQSKVSTIALVDVSDSVSDKQLAAARAYVDQIAAA